MCTMAVLLGAQLVTLLLPVPRISAFPFLQISSSQQKDDQDQGGVLGTGCGDKQGLHFLKGGAWSFVYADSLNPHTATRPTPLSFYICSTHK